MKRIFLISAFALGILASCNGPQHSTTNGSDSMGTTNSSGSMSSDSSTTTSGSSGMSADSSSTMHADSTHKDSM